MINPPPRNERKSTPGQRKNGKYTEAASYTAAVLLPGVGVVIKPFHFFNRPSSAAVFVVFLVLVVFVVLMMVVVAIIAIIIYLGNQPDNTDNTGNDDGILCHRDR